jgi:cell division protein ZipA
MELSVRDWMVIVGILLILAILLDGYRRMRNDRPGKIKVALVKVPQDDKNPDHLLSAHELPKGGARVIGRSAEQEVLDPEKSGKFDPSELDNVPVIAIHDDDTKLAAGFSASSHELEVEVSESTSPPTPDRKKITVSRVPSLGSVEFEEVVMLNVLARNTSGFAGGDLLQILLACDLRFGDSNFFHRHEESSGRGQIQFSVASMVNPGVFDIDQMEFFLTPGVVFFLSLPGPKDAMQAFEYMLETAQVVANNLEGNVLDEARSVMTKQTIEHCRQRIREFERKMLAQNVL